VKGKIVRAEIEIKRTFNLFLCNEKAFPHLIRYVKRGGFQRNLRTGELERQLLVCHAGRRKNINFFHNKWLYGNVSMKKMKKSNIYTEFSFIF
jgi:hypothetical protein